jgi:hypothetical protein
LGVRWYLGTKAGGYSDSLLLVFCLILAVFVGGWTRFVSPTVATTTILSNLDARKGIIWARLIWAPVLLSRSDLYIDAQQYISALKKPMSFPKPNAHCRHIFNQAQVLIQRRFALCDIITSVLGEPFEISENAATQEGR